MLKNLEASVEMLGLFFSEVVDWLLVVPIAIGRLLVVPIAIGRLLVDWLLVVPIAIGRLLVYWLLVYWLLVISLLVTGDLGISRWKLVILEAITLRQMFNYALMPLCLSAFMP
jgi:hypothetical protein